MGSVRRVWRRFRPVKSTPHSSPVNLFAESAREVNDIIQSLPVSRWKKFDLLILTPIIEDRRKMAELSGSALDWVVALVLQAPRAAEAQRRMDQHPHGFSGRHERLYELIDFNDSFVSAVLSLAEADLPHFQTELKKQIDWLCARLRKPGFTDEQYEAITHGLSREIAVYRGAIAEGLMAEMTSRTQDAKGVDMVITEPSSMRAINVDIKTPSAYYYRLKDLHHEGRLPIESVERAEVEGFCMIRNDHGSAAVTVVLLRIDPEEVGEIQNFTFTDTRKLGEVLRHVIAQHGATIKVGRVNEYAG